MKTNPGVGLHFDFVENILCYSSKHDMAYRIRVTKYLHVMSVDQAVIKYIKYSSRELTSNNRAILSLFQYFRAHSHYHVDPKHTASLTEMGTNS